MRATTRRTNSSLRQNSPMPFALSPVEVRVLGVLVEKEAVTPAVYPMTLNGVVTACNQSSSRNPVMAVTELEATYATGSLKARGMLRHVHAKENRVVKYRHVLDEIWDLDQGALAVLAVLCLRGPQTVGELKSRTERLYPFSGPEVVRAALAHLEERDEPLVCCMPRLPGQRDARWTHLLFGAPAAEEGPYLAAEEGRYPPDETGIPRDQELAARVSELERLLAHAMTRIERLTIEIDDLR